MGKLPAYLFYVKDWRTDPALCRVSKTARDTWMDMNCLMFDSEERGVLISGSKPWTDEEIAGAVRGEYSTNLRDIRLLLDMGVAFRDQRGAIFCKRMVRDEQERKAAAERKRKSRLSHGDVTATRETAPATETKVLTKSNQSQNQTNGEEVFLVERSDQAPEGFPVSALGMGLLGKLGIPNSVINLRAVSAAIETAAKSKNLTPARATDFLLKLAREAQVEGEKVNRFWFEDGLQVWEGRIATAADRERLRERERAQVGLYRPS